MASTQLHYETEKLMRLAGQNEPETFTATLRRCEKFREDCRNAESALRAHKLDGRCSGKVPLDSDLFRLETESSEA